MCEHLEITLKPEFQAQADEIARRVRRRAEAASEPPADIPDWWDVEDAKDTIQWFQDRGKAPETK